jgi:hypothetical protein
LKHLDGDALWDELSHGLAQEVAFLELTHHPVETHCKGADLVLGGHRRLLLQIPGSRLVEGAEQIADGTIQ